MRQDPDAYERMKETNRRWAATHPEYERERGRRRRKDPVYNEKHKVIHRAYRRRNPEKCREFKRRRREKDPEKWLIKGRQYVHARKARKKGANVCDFTAAQWIQLKREFNFCCAYCDQPTEHLTQDHMLPLSRGGDHTLLNIVPACVSCNCRKGTKTTEEFLL